jgi:solute carrier family 41
MKQVDQLIMIIPVILNLKGNLEMNLSARLGTAANVGELDKPDVRRKLVLGNLSLLQVQAAVVSFVAACVSFILGLVVPHIVPAQQRPSTGTEPAEVANNVFRFFKSTLLMHQARRPRPPIPPLERKSGIVE